MVGRKTKSGHCAGTERRRGPLRRHGAYGNQHIVAEVQRPVLAQATRMAAIASFVIFPSANGGVSADGLASCACRRPPGVRPRAPLPRA
jgi:hypothetical protein